MRNRRAFMSQEALQGATRNSAPGLGPALSAWRKCPHCLLDYMPLRCILAQVKPARRPSDLWPGYNSSLVTSKRASHLRTHGKRRCSLCATTAGSAVLLLVLRRQLARFECLEYSPLLSGCAKPFSRSLPCGCDPPLMSGNCAVR